MRGRRRLIVWAGAALTGSLLVGCSALGIERTGDEATSSPAATTSTPATSSPTATPTGFGQDATPPRDGVGSLAFDQLDRWSVSNEDENVHATFIAVPQAPALVGTQQEQVSRWLAEYRAMQGVPGGTVTGSAEDDTGPGADGTDDTAPSPQTEAGTAPATTTTVTTTTGPTSQPAPGVPGGTGPEGASLRVVPQLVSDDSVVGVRLYARLTDGREVREHLRTFWADSTGTELSGVDLVAQTSVGQARRHILTLPGGEEAAQLSDTDLFSAVAFTTSGDLVLYLPGQRSSDVQVVIRSEDAEPLLSEIGRTARAAAQDAVPPGGDDPAQEDPTTSPTASPTVS